MILGGRIGLVFSKDPDINLRGGSKKIVFWWINDSGVLLLGVVGIQLVFDIHRGKWFGTDCWYSYPTFWPFN